MLNIETQIKREEEDQGIQHFNPITKLQKEKKITSTNTDIQRETRDETSKPYNTKTEVSRVPLKVKGNIKEETDNQQILRCVKML